MGVFIDYEMEGLIHDLSNRFYSFSFSLEYLVIDNISARI